MPTTSRPDHTPAAQRSAQLGRRYRWVEFLALTASDGMFVISYAGRPAVAITPAGLDLFARTEALEPDHPTRRWVTCLAIFVQEVLSGRLSGPLTSDRADHFARCALMPDSEFAELADLDDVLLAETFAVPPEQVAQKRLDLVVHATQEG